jgi:hypothetical protein
VRAYAAAMRERRQDGSIDQFDEIHARLTQPHALAQHLANDESLTDKRVEADAARRYVAPGRARREGDSVGLFQRFDDFRFDEGDVPTVARRGRIVAQAVGIPISLQADPGQRAGGRHPAHRSPRAIGEVDVFDAAARLRHDLGILAPRIQLSTIDNESKYNYRMTAQEQDHAMRLEAAVDDVDALRRKVQALQSDTGNEDLEHADLGLQIVRHAIEEVIEHTGLGGHIASTPDRALHDRVKSWRGQLTELRSAATQLLAEHANKDLETALKALEIADGSLHEVEERYE